LLFALALVFASSTILYTTLWMISNGRPPDVELGFDETPAYLVLRVQQNSPAERAGLRPGDRVMAINGIRLKGLKSLYSLYRPSKPGDSVQVTVARPGEPSQIVLTAIFRRRPSVPEQRSWTESLAALLLHSYPVPFVVMAIVVLFLRLEDRRVWHLALLFASFNPGPGGVQFDAIPAEFRTFTIVYQILGQGFIGPLFYSFFAVFPERSPLDRRLQWLRWASLITVALGTLALVLPAVHVPGLRLPAYPDIFGKTSQLETLFILSILTCIVLGIISLATNYFETRNPEARRKLRVIFLGTAIAFPPLLISAFSHFFVDYQDPPWLDVAIILILSIFPISFAYAVVKHRVLEIPVLLKRSARYLFVQRGFTVLLALISVAVTVLFASSFTRYLRPLMELAQPAGIALGAVFGTVLLWGGSQVHKRVSAQIDRAFFRSAYDARIILEDLAEETRASTDRGELARLLEHHLTNALQPSSLVIYFLGSDGNLAAVSGSPPAELRTISGSLPILRKLAERGQPQEISSDSEGPAENSGLGLLHAECLVPLMGRAGHLVGLLALGPRLSEEPYSGEDKRLLASIAGQAGTALENIRLAEDIANRIEVERRNAREMEIAREVQTRLLPQEPPRLKTLDCAARCIETRSVGGDYYDFLDLGGYRVGLVLADVSGKGVHAALLMANLQAYLRSQSGIAPLDPSRLLQQVNRMLWKTTSAEHFATLFFAIYDDSSRQISYLNCGHNAALCVRQDGSVQRLTATATVIGLFENWECEEEQLILAPGDLLVIFSDGVTEAARGEEEYGEARLIHGLQASRHLPVNEIVQTVFASVQSFSAGAQADDLTLLIAKART